MSDDHDEPPLATDERVPEAKSKSKQSNIISAKTNITTVQKEKAALEETNFRVLLELEGNGSEQDQPGIDIVVVLDVSGSTADAFKLDNMKNAALFLINILTENHRLSLVTFSNKAVVRCPLRCMTVEAKDEIGGLVRDLHAGGGTNIAAGLRLGVNILKGRKYSRGRVPAIILVSDGDQGHRYDDARDVAVDQVSVFTVGLGNGSGYNPEVLNTIAKKSKGGTFSIVDIQYGESNNLHTAFALCLGWLLSVVVLDLQMTITTVQSGVKINSVLPAYYPIDQGDYTTTIQLGHLCNGEKRSFLVDLQLPGVANDGEYKVLEITYSYLYDGEPFDSKPKMVTVFRTNESLEEEKIEIDVEKKRIETLDRMEEAKHLANALMFDEAKNQLEEAKNSLDGLNYSIIKALKSQLKQLIDLMDTNLYKSKGHHIVLSTLTSHYRQREAITNDDLIQSNLFATDAMVKFAENIQGLIMDVDDKTTESISKLVQYFQDLLQARKTNE